MNYLLKFWFDLLCTLRNEIYSYINKNWNSFASWIAQECLECALVCMISCKSSMKSSLNLIQIKTIFCFVSLCNDAFKQKSKSSKYTTCNKVFFRTRRFALQTHYQCVTLQMLFDKCLYLTWTWVLHLRINSFNFIMHTHEKDHRFFLHSWCKIR